MSTITQQIRSRGLELKPFSVIFIDHLKKGKLVTGLSYSQLLDQFDAGLQKNGAI